MQFTLSDLTGSNYENTGIRLPAYDVRRVREESIKNPRWVHFGIGNIFRVFLGRISELMIESGMTNTGVSCVESFDFEVVDRIYRPYDNLSLSVILHADGRVDRSVTGSFAEALKADPAEEKDWNRLVEIFTSKSLQMVTFTITEKGYPVKDGSGEFIPFVLKDIEAGPSAPTGTMAILAKMLYERFKAGRTPLAMCSLDNCEKNGSRLRESILTICEEWNKRGFVNDEFMEYVSDEHTISFPWSMIDKITPRPFEAIAKDLEKDGLEGMDIVVTSKNTYIAPFVNAEDPQYLVIEDSFPNGRPPLEKAGVYLADRETVEKSERMKVTVCLNPIHTGVCTYAILLGYDMFADAMADEDLRKLAERIGLVEGMKVVPDPGILSPKAFIDEVLNERFVNTYLGDTTERIAVDISHMVGIRFGVTIKSYLEMFGTTKELVAIPLAIAGWLRYVLETDDEGNAFNTSPDPGLPDIKKQLSGITIGEPDSADGKLEPILRNRSIFGLDLYEAGLGEFIEQLFKEEISSKGAVRKVLKKYLG